MKKIILEGLPGIGKTTLVKKISIKLMEMNVEVSGFYTEELRNNNNQRMGFDIVTLDNKRGALARKGTGNDSKYKVGTYDVHLDEFEKIAIPVFENLKTVLIIDEIGKMELFSKKFQQKIAAVLADQNLKIVATVPLKSGAPLIQNLKQSTSTNLFTVTAANRDKLLEEIISQIIK